MLSTFSTLFRANVAEAEEALIDRNAATLLAQHLRDAKVALATRRAAAARLMARETALIRRRDECAARIERREGEARAALEKQDEDLAEAVANDILALEDTLAVIRTDCDQLSRQIAVARTGLTKAEATFADLTEQLRRARDVTLTRHAARPHGAAHPAGEDALDRATRAAETLRARDQDRADLDAAMERLNDDLPTENLNARIKAAGINDDSTARRAALLKRIKGETK